MPAAEGETLAWLYRSAEVLSRSDGEDAVALTVRVPDKNLDLFRKRAGRYIVEPVRPGRRG